MNQQATHAPCRGRGDDEHLEACPFCGALPMAHCRYEPELDGVDQARAEDEAHEPDLDGGEEAYWAGVAEGEWVRRNLGQP